MKQFTARRLVTALCVSGMLGLSPQVFASAFQLWEQDAASVGNYHAGYAAEANSASIAWYNPAGITRFKNQQITLGAVAIMSDFKYKGSVTVGNSLPAPLPPLVSTTFNNVTVQGGQFAVVPNLHYVAPINDRLGFGFSVDSPFGLKTDYGVSTPLKYAATMTSITVVDISPSLGLKVTDKASLGAGFDVQRAFAEFNNFGVIVTTPGTDTPSINNANDTAYGYHLGALYEFNDNARVGLSYHSQVVHHLNGYSSLQGPIATSANAQTGQTGDELRSHAAAGVTLPPYTALSVYDKVDPKWAVMGSIIYTQWSTFKTLRLESASAVVSGTFPRPLIRPATVDVVIPENYSNSWNVSVGADYFACDDITLRGGLGFDQTPVNNNYRNVQLPDNDRYTVSLGMRYKVNKAVGLDGGWTHLFLKQSRVTPPTVVTGAQQVSTSGHVNGGADVLGAQLTWDIV
jgi:long-chain fatty acid transport protein